MQAISYEDVKAAEGQVQLESDEARITAWKTSLNTFGDKIVALEQVRASLEGGREHVEAPLRRSTGNETDCSLRCIAHRTRLSRLRRSRGGHLVLPPVAHTISSQLPYAAGRLFVRYTSL